MLPNIKRETLQNEILKNVTPFAKVYTDEAGCYDGLSRKYVHKVINHSQEYVNGQVHTQGIENFWSLLKRTLRGTYIAVEAFHLDAYLDEQVFRYNNRATKDNPLNDLDRFMLAVSQVEGRDDEELTGKVEGPADETPFNLHLVEAADAGRWSRSLPFLFAAIRWFISVFDTFMIGAGLR